MAADHRIVQSVRARHELLTTEIEEYRDSCWQRDGEGRVETAVQSERFIERVGFAACFLDSRRPGPSLYMAVCGRRDAVIPRNVQKDPETSHTWALKDEIVHRGRVYYAKLSPGRAMFLAPRMIPYFTTRGKAAFEQERVRPVTLVAQGMGNGNRRLAGRLRSD